MSLRVEVEVEPVPDGRVSICVAPQEVVVGWQLLPCTVLHGVARLDVERFNGVVPPWLQVPRPLLPYRKMHK